MPEEKNILRITTSEIFQKYDDFLLRINPDNDDWLLKITKEGKIIFSEKCKELNPEEIAQEFMKKLEDHVIGNNNNNNPLKWEGFLIP